jgi:hypothetical protein
LNNYNTTENNYNIDAAKRFYKRLGIVLGCIFLFIVLVLCWLGRTPPLLQPFPNYPNSTEVNGTLPHGYHGLLDISCDGWYFGGEKYKILATQDDETEVLAFYRKLANDKNLYEYTGATGSEYNNQGTALCFLGESDNRKVPTNSIIIFNPNNTEHAKIISDVFPKAPTDKLIIITLQGLIFYSI